MPPYLNNLMNYETAVLVKGGFPFGGRHKLYHPFVGSGWKIPMASYQQIKLQPEHIKVIINRFQIFQVFQLLSIKIRVTLAVL